MGEGRRQTRSVTRSFCDSDIDGDAGVSRGGTSCGRWCQTNSNISWSFGWMVGEEVGRLHGDVDSGTAEAGKWSQGGNNCMHGVSASIGEGGFGVVAAGEEMVAKRVKRLAAGAKVVARVGRD